MTLVRRSAFTALGLVSMLAAQQASAQALRGFRVEAQGAYSQFNSEGNHHSKAGVGGAAGVDFDLGGFVLGPEVTFLWSPIENKTVEGGGLAERKSFDEWTLALRAGLNVTPTTFVYAKGGYVRNEQRKRFTPMTATGALDSSAPGFYYDHFWTGGWQWGGGINQMLGVGGFYASLEGRYSRYNDKLNLGSTHRIVGLVGLGYLFGAAQPAPPPPPPLPPPPPPPPPATQTCPDGSVILATDTCPAPPPPPPPPPPPAQKGERGQ